MKQIILPLSFCLFFLAGCLTTPVADSGGMGSVTVPNTNVNALTAAAQNVFANSGYTPGPGNYPNSISFEKPAGAFGKVMWGSYGQTTTIRVHLKMVQIPGTNDYRLIPKVSRVSDAGEAGFEQDTRMMGMWAGQFGPLLQKIKTQAAGMGPM